MKIALIAEKKIITKEQANDLENGSKVKMLYLSDIPKEIKNLSFKKVNLVITFTQKILDRKSISYIFIQKFLKANKVDNIEVSMEKNNLKNHKITSKAVIQGFGSLSFELIKKIIDKQYEK